MCCVFIQGVVRGVLRRSRSRVDVVLEVLVLDRSVHRVALDRVAALHLDVLRDGLSVFARTRDRELGQVDVEARRVDARGEVLAHLRRHGPGVLAVLEARERLVVTDRLDEVVDVVLGGRDRDSRGFASGFASGRVY